MRPLARLDSSLESCSFYPSRLSTTSSGSDRCRKLVGQIGLAAVAMAFGLVINSIASPFGGEIELPVVLAVPFTLSGSSGMVNTVNVIDTMDGLAAGVAAIAAIVLFVRSVSLGQDTIGVSRVALAGVCIGFLRFSFNPVRIIMGTSGSTFLGFALATFSIIGGAKIATAAFVLGLPIIDFAMVIIQRSAPRRSRWWRRRPSSPSAHSTRSVDPTESPSRFPRRVLRRPAARWRWG